MTGFKDKRNEEIGHYGQTLIRAAEPGFPFVVVSCRLFFCKFAGVFPCPSEAQRRRASSATANQQNNQPPPDSYRDQQATTPILATLSKVQTIPCQRKTTIKSNYFSACLSFLLFLSTLNF